MDGGTVDEVIKTTVGKVGENIQLKRVATCDIEGQTGGYIHGGGKLAVLVALQTAQSGAAVDAIAKDVAMHVAAHDPTPIAIDRDDMPADAVEKERAFLVQQAQESGKPENVIEKMVDGRINKFFQENTLLAQGFVKDPDKSVRDILKEASEAAGGDIAVASFVRFALGDSAES